jgi:predicted transcriptional regulator
MEELKLLREVLKTSSLGKVAKELGVSRATVSLVKRQLYPNPQRIYHKIRKRYGYTREIIGATISGVGDQIDLIKNLLEEIENV